MRQSQTCRFLTQSDMIFSLFSQIRDSIQVGWFGIQAEIAGEGLEAIWPLKPWLWTVTNGAFVTIVAAFGFRYIVGVAWVTGPAFFVVLVWACAASIQDPSPMKQVNVELSVFEGIGIVVGGYIAASFCLSCLLLFYYYFFLFSTFSFFFLLRENTSCRTTRV